VKIDAGGPLAEEAAPPQRPSFLGAFHFRDFRLLWFGLLISNLGTWLQFTGLGYEVVHLAPNAHLGALYLGLIGASRAVPVLLLSPIAGVVADRFPRRAVLATTNSVTALLAFALAVLIATGHASIGWLMLLSGLAAGTQSFDTPARQSWVPGLVPREYVSNAIGLNSIAFNGPAVIGPPIAGLFIAASGVAFCMYANAVSTLAVVVALFFMKPAPPSSTVRSSMFAAIGAGLAFLFGHPVLRWILVELIVVSLFVRPYNFLMPAYAAHALGTDAHGLGALLAANGVGAILGAVVTATVVPARRSVLWTGAAIVMGAGAIALGLVPQIDFAFVVLAVMGMATMAFINASNILLQTLAPDDMRGRAISVYSMILLGLVPAGSLLIGAIAAQLDLREAFIIGGSIVALSALGIYLRDGKLRAV
jgi:MFS family permease